MTVQTESTKSSALTDSSLALSARGDASAKKQRSFAEKHSLLLGIGFTLAVSVIGWAASLLSGFDRLGPLACSIGLAVLYRYFCAYPEGLRQGIQFSSKTLLRLAIILFGLKLDIHLVLNEGPGLLLKAALVIVFAVLLTTLLGKLFKADPAITLLLGIGTGICGAAAIAAVSPILRTKDEETAIGAGMIALIGTIFAVGYTLLRPLLPLDSVEYGAWSGISLHEIAHVALAAAPAGHEALSAALLAKLSRVLLLIPFCFLLLAWQKNRRDGAERKDVKLEFPSFLLGFVAASLAGSYIFVDDIAIPPTIMNGISIVTTLLLSMAMVGLGLNVNLKQLRTKALKPVLAMLLTSVLLSVLTYLWL